MAAVVESHFTTLFLINILAFMEWLFQEHCVILCTYWMVLNQTSGLEPKQIMTDTAGYSDLVFGLLDC